MRSPVLSGWCSETLRSLFSSQTPLAELGRRMVPSEPVKKQWTDCLHMAGKRTPALLSASALQPPPGGQGGGSPGLSLLGFLLLQRFL